jgi:hypothetical protein
MTRLPALLGLCAAIAALPGCLGQQPVLKAGDATSAEVMYSGDVANALPLAKQHCAGYERVPRLVDTIPGIAYFACERP